LYIDLVLRIYKMSACFERRIIVENSNYDIHCSIVFNQGNYRVEVAQLTRD